MPVHAAWKVRAVRRDARDPYPSRRMIWLAGRTTHSVRRCATQDCVIVYGEDVDDSCVKCIHVVCLWISVISLDPLGLSWINLLTLYYKRQQNVFSPFTLWRNLISRNRNVKKNIAKMTRGTPLPSPPLPSPPVTQRIHSPFQPKQSPSSFVSHVFRTAWPV